MYQLRDIAVSPDDYHTKDYEALHRSNSTPLVIDNGEFCFVAAYCVCTCRVDCRELHM